MIATIQMIVSGTPDRTPGSAWMPRNGNVKRSTQTTEPRRHRGREHLAAELLEPAQPAEVVDRADGDGDGRAEQQPARVAAERQERERGHEDAEEEREPAEPRHRRAVDPAAAGRIDDAEKARHPADRRRQQHHDDERDERTPDDLQVVAENVDDAVVRRGSKHQRHLSAVRGERFVPRPGFNQVAVVTKRLRRERNQVAQQPGCSLQAVDSSTQRLQPG